MILSRSRAGGRWVLSVSCESCGSLFERQERVYMRAANDDLCRSCSNRKAKTGSPEAVSYACTSCGVAVTRGYSMCKSCSHSHPAVHCGDCGVQVTAGALRCLPCHNKNQNKGLSRPRTLFNVSPAWRRVRQSCFERDNFCCQSCGTRGWGAERPPHLFVQRPPSTQT